MTTPSERYYYVCLDNISNGYPFMRGYRTITGTTGQSILQNAMIAFGIRETPLIQAWTSSEHWYTNAYRIDTMDAIPADVEFIWLRATTLPSTHPLPTPPSSV